ncbi:conserved hypothetical protein [Vibrio parahaemolyticus AQ3810]|nr:conserved hypothetical protein [Vibrio parahaemolyticus AQ3810]
MVSAGDALNTGDVIVTENNASLDVLINNELYLVDQNCVACLPEPSSEQPETLVQTPVDGQIAFDPTAIDSANFDANDVAAIQQAILEGADPTAILEATAAGSTIWNIGGKNVFSSTCDLPVGSAWCDWPCVDSTR